MLPNQLSIFVKALKVVARNSIEVPAELHILGDQSLGNKLTVRHLLNHTSGLADYWFDNGTIGDWSGKSFQSPDRDERFSIVKTPDFANPRASTHDMGVSLWGAVRENLVPCV